MSSIKENTKKDTKNNLGSTPEIRELALASYTAILSKTIYLFQNTESHGMSLSEASSIVFDFTRNYIMYALPMELLKHIEDAEQFKHDTYLLTKETIDKCGISQTERETLSLILKEPFYAFNAKTYNNLHLQPYISYMKNGISYNKEELDSEEVLVYKTLCYPFITFFTHKYPISDKDLNNKPEESINTFLITIINAFSQMCILDTAINQEVIKPIPAILNLLEYSLNTIKKNMTKEAFKYSTDTLLAGYKVLVNVSDDNKDKDLLKIIKLINKFNNTNGESNERKSRKTSASSTVSRKPRTSKTTRKQG